MRFGILALALLLTLSAPGARAEDWYRWADGEGVHVSRTQPGMGVPYEKIEVPDPVAWLNAPAMPGEAGAEATAAGSAKSFFKRAAKSVLAVMASRVDASGATHWVTVGSAVAISAGEALTNCHVVEAIEGEVYLAANVTETPQVAAVAASDYVADRCVLSVQGGGLSPVAGVRTVDSLEVGEPVYTIGNPGRMERTLADGLLSGKRRIGEHRFLQFTAPISPGSSGGGLFDASGNLLGITNMSLKGSQNINFAIPAEDYWNSR